MDPAVPTHVCMWGCRAASTAFLPLWLPLDILNLLSPTLHIAHMLLGQRQAETVLSSSMNCSWLPKANVVRALLWTSQHSYTPSAQFRGTWAIWGMPGYLRHPQRAERSDAGPIRDLMPPMFRHLNNNYHVNEPNTCSFLPLTSLIPCTLLLPHNEVSSRTNHNSALFPRYVQGMTMSGGTASPLLEHQFDTSVGYPSCVSPHRCQHSKVRGKETALSGTGAWHVSASTCMLSSGLNNWQPMSATSQNRNSPALCQSIILFPVLRNYEALSYRI